MRPQAVPLLAIASLLAACAGGPTGPAPVTNLDAKTCTPANGGPVSRVVPFGPDKAVTVEIDGSIPCKPGANGNHTIEITFELPQTETSYLLTVTSIPVGGTIFSPRIELIGADGKVTRALGRDQFRAHGPALYAGVRALPTDRTLVIASDPTPIGQTSSQIAEGVNASVVAAGGAFFVVRTGVESNTTYTLAFNGRIKVAAQPWPQSDPAIIRDSSGSRPNP